MEGKEGQDLKWGLEAAIMEDAFDWLAPRLLPVHPRLNLPRDGLSSDLGLHTSIRHQDPSPSPLPAGQPDLHSPSVEAPLSDAAKLYQAVVT